MLLRTTIQWQEQFAEGQRPSQRASHPDAESQPCSCRSRRLRAYAQSKVGELRHGTTTFPPEVSEPAQAQISPTYHNIISFFTTGDVVSQHRAKKLWTHQGIESDPVAFFVGVIPLPVSIQRSAAFARRNRKFSCDPERIIPLADAVAADKTCE